MTEKRTCKQCGRKFGIFRTFKNRHAAIRFCQDCKEGFTDVLKSERPAVRVTSTKTGKSRLVYLATN